MTAKEIFEVGKWYSFKYVDDYYKGVVLSKDDNYCRINIIKNGNCRGLSYDNFSEIRGIRKPRKKVVPKHRLKVLVHCPHCQYVTTTIIKTSGLSKQQIYKVYKKDNPYNCCGPHKENLVPIERTEVEHAT